MIDFWKPIGLGASAIALAAAASTAFFMIDRNHWRDVARTLLDEANNVVISLRIASGNDDVTWETTAGQIVALGESHRQLKEHVAVQNQTIVEMAEEAIRLEAEHARLQELADKAKAQRKAALLRLSDLQAPPEVKRDCQILVEEANQALDLIYEQGF